MFTLLYFIYSSPRWTFIVEAVRWQESLYVLRNKLEQGSLSIQRNDLFPAIKLKCSNLARTIWFEEGENLTRSARADKWKKLRTPSVSRENYSRVNKFLWHEEIRTRQTKALAVNGAETRGWRERKTGSVQRALRCARGRQGKELWAPNEKAGVALGVISAGNDCWNGSQTPWSGLQHWESRRPWRTWRGLCAIPVFLHSLPPHSLMLDKSGEMWQEVNLVEWIKFFFFDI